MGFNWLDPVVGKGDTPEQADRNRKLRQAISIAFDWEEYVAVFENSQASVAYGPVPRVLLGYREPPEGVNPVVYDLVDGKPVRKPMTWRAGCWPRPVIPTAAMPGPARRWCCTTTP